MNKFFIKLILCMGSAVLLTHTASAQWVQIDHNRFIGATEMCLAVGYGKIFARTFNGIFRSAENDTSWTAVGPIGVKSFAVSGSNLFAGRQWGGGVFLSTDSGTSWTAVNSGLTNKNVYSLAVSGNNIFAGTAGGGVFLSTDNGASWTAAGLPNRTVGSLAVSGSNIFATVSDGGVYHSSNNGANWKAVNSGGLPFYRYWRLAASGNNIFAGSSGGGIYRSSDFGATWTAVNSGLPESTWVCSFAVSGNNILAGTSDGVFRSTDSGTSWAECNSGLPGWTVDNLAVGESYIFASVTASAMHWIWRRPLSEIVGAVKVSPQHNTSLQGNVFLRSAKANDSKIHLEFFLSHSDFVSLKVFDITGHETATLVNKNLESGTHSILWYTRNIPASFYIARMQTGSNTCVRSVPIFH